MSVNTLTSSSTAAPPRPPMPEIQKPGLHLDYLDGLRGFAALWVVCGHAFLFEWGWDAVLGRHGLALNWLHYLRFAVDIFIVLSGFCLAIPVVRADGALRGGAAAFFKKRVRRILPPYFAALALALAFDALAAWVHHDHFHVTKKELAANLLLLQDCRPDLNQIDSPMWSVALEWKIYFLFPLVVFLLRRFGKVGMLLGTAAIGYGVARVTPHLGICPDAWFVFLFGMGVCGSAVAFGKSAADCVRPTVAVLLASLAGLALLVHRYPVHDLPSYITSAHHFWITDTVVGAVTASALVLLNRGGRAGGLLALPQRALSWRPLVCLGTFSYSLYLVHNPMQLPLHYLLNSPHLDHLNPMQRFAALSVGGTALCIGAAYLFHLAFEKPFMTPRRADALGVTAQGGVFRLRPAPGSEPARPAPEGRAVEAGVSRGDAKPRLHLDYLDGMRALAALWVILAHTWITQFGFHANPGLKGLLSDWLAYVHFAVDVFIVLSGFVLMLPVARAGYVLKGGAIDFFKKRARRILPPYYAALLFALCVNWVFPYTPLSSLHPPRFVMLSHLLLLSDLPLPNAGIFNLTFWSVALEWKIYFLFPLVVWLTRRWGGAGLLAVSALASYGLHAVMSRYFPIMGGYSVWYVFLFCGGAYASTLAFGPARDSGGAQGSRVKRVALSLAALCALLAALIHLWPITSRPFPESLAAHCLRLPILDGVVGAVTACFLLLLALAPSGETALGRAAHTVRQALGWRPLVTLGTFSYSLYLTHYPIVLSCSDMLGMVPISRGHKAILMFFACVPFAIGLSYLFHLAVEKPFMTTRKKEAPATEAPAEADRDAALSPAP